MHCNRLHRRNDKEGKSEGSGPSEGVAGTALTQKVIKNELRYRHLRFYTSHLLPPLKDETSL